MVLFISFEDHHSSTMAPQSGNGEFELLSHLRGDSLNWILEKRMTFGEEFLGNDIERLERSIAHVEKFTLRLFFSSLCKSEKKYFAIWCFWSEKYSAIFPKLSSCSTKLWIYKFIAGRADLIW